jgi:predicted nucleic acid-binding protein
MPLVDSSIWIGAQDPHSEECRALKKLLLNVEETVFTAKIIQLEVCQGARTEREFEFLWSSFFGLEFLKIEEDHWEESAKNYMSCKKEGLNVSTIDCLIATLSRSYRVDLWSKDKIFSSLSKIIGFRRYQP